MLGSGLDVMVSVLIEVAEQLVQIACNSAQTTSPLDRSVSSFQQAQNITKPRTSQHLTIGIGTLSPEVPGPLQ